MQIPKKYITNYSRQWKRRKIHFIAVVANANAQKWLQTEQKMCEYLNKVQQSQLLPFPGYVAGQLGPKRPLPTGCPEDSTLFLLF